MKKFTCLLTFLSTFFILTNSFSQKVVVIGMNHTTPDGFSFVATETISIDEIIYFTDNEYSDAANAFTWNGSPSGEAVVIFTAITELSAGDVVFVNETSTNMFTTSCSGGCGNAVISSFAGNGSFALSTNGDGLYAYSGIDGNPTDPGSITEIYSVLFTGSGEAPAQNGGPIPVDANPVADHPTAVVVDGFPDDSDINFGPLRVEFSFNPASLRDGVSQVGLENPTNYLSYVSNQALSIVPFTNLNLSGSNPVLTVAVSPTSVNENSGTGMVYTFTLDAPAVGAITADFTVGGTATFTSDYTQIGASPFSATAGSVTIPNGGTTATVTLTPVGDTGLEPDETAILTIVAGTGYDAGSPSIATGTILNDDTQAVTPLVAVTGNNHEITEGFSFVALVDIPASTTVYFTDENFNKNSLSFTNTSEGVYSWTSPGSIVLRGEVIVATETTANNFATTCDTGTCGTVATLSGVFALSSVGESFYAYSDSNSDPTDGITEIHSVLHTGDGIPGGNIPTLRDPTGVYVGSVVVDGFAAVNPNRTEYKFASGERLITVDQANFQNTSNWLHAQANAGLSLIPFANIIIATGSTNPTATVTVSPSSVVEDSGSGMVYTFMLDAPAVGTITVNFTVAGSASFTTDYTQTGAGAFTATNGSVDILNGNNSAIVTVTPVVDTDVEPLETIELMLASGTGYNGGTPNDATGTISNDDTSDSNPMVAITGLNHVSPDGFSFVAARNIPAGTIVYFSEDEFDNTTLMFSTGESVIRWQSPVTEIPKGDVIVVSETAPDVFSLTCNGATGASCGSIVLISGNLALATNGETFYAYEDNDIDPTNGVMDIYAVLYTGNSTVSGGAIPVSEDPSGIYLNALVIDGFPSSPPGRTEYDATKRGVPVNMSDFEVLANWVHAQPNAPGLSPVPFAALSIVDAIPPIITCPDDITQTADASSCNAVVVIIDPTATDNLPGLITFTGVRSDAPLELTDTYPVGVTTITWTATDANGNDSETCVQTITITDDEVPVITCPEDITQTADADSCDAVVTITDPTATDNCTATVTFAGVRSDALELTDPYPVGETTITWTATDAALNNSTTCPQKITITDDEAPVIICAADIEQTADDDKCDAIVTIAEPTATDNCTGIVTFAGVRSDALPLTDPYPLGETTITWTATDVALNDSETCVQKITITDDQVPVITCLADIEQTADVDKCDAVVTITDPTAIDNCTGTVTFAGVRSDALELTDPYPVGETTITWTATDEALNDSETCMQKITITDDQVPVITCAVDIVQTADVDKCDAVVIITDPTATDNCTGPVTFAGVRSDALELTDPYPVGETTITWTATDEALNDSDTCVQKITITDDQAPVITCPTDIEQTADAGLCDAIVSIVDPTATDNCTETVIFAGVRSDGLQLNEPYPLGETTIIWIATDAEGNDSDTCMQKITITDDEAPEITCLADITQTADANSCDANVVILDPIAFDNCTGAITITGERSDALPLTDAYPIGETTITWTATDVALNASETCVQTITVTDDEDPMIFCPGNIVQTTDIDSCDAYIIYDVTSSDNCTGETITQTAGLSSGSNFPFGTTTNTFVVTDASGNTATCSFDVKISKIITRSVVTVTPDNQQYSDLVTFEATLSPGACTSGGQAASSVSFYVGTQHVGTTTLSLVSDELVGTLTAPLLESPSNPSNGQMAPGSHDVKAVFGGINTNFTVTDATTSLFITQEDAIVEYTGQSLQATASSSSTSADVILSANVQDINDGLDTRGDIRNAQVKFVNRDTNTDISGWIPVIDLIDVTDNTTGTVSFTYTINLSGSNTSESVTIGIVVGVVGDNGYYFRDDSNDNTVVTVYQPVGDFVTGGGHITPYNSAGVYASSDGLKTNFGFNVKYNKKGNKLKGHMNVIFRRMEFDGVHTYQIKGNAIQSLGVNIADENNKTAVFVTKSNLKDVTDELNPVSLGGNLILKVDMTDRGEPGFDDSIAFNLTNNSNTLLYSSNWTGISTSEMLLSGGNLVVHSGFSTSNSSANRELDPFEIVFDTFEVTTWPNPSDKYFNLKLKSDNTKDRVEIHVFNAVGKLVHHEIGTSTQEFTFGKTFSIGTYMVHITQSNKQYRVRLIRK